MVAGPAVFWSLRREDFARSGDVDASTYVLRVTANAVTEDLTTAALTSGRNYWINGSGRADSDVSGGQGDVLKILETMLESHSELGAGVEVLLGTDIGSTEGIVKIKTGGITSTILWNHTNTTLNAEIFGFAQADSTSDVQWSGTSVAAGAWHPDQAVAEDSRQIAQNAIVSAVSLTGDQRTVKLTAGKALRELSWTMLPQERALEEYATTDSAEGLWEALCDGMAVEYWESSLSAPAVFAPAYVQSEIDISRRDSLIKRDGDSRYQRWRVDLPLRSY